MSQSTLIKSFPLANTKNGVISVSNVDKPYGENSAPVASIGISLKGDDNAPDWKAHIPYDNIDEVINALNEAKEKFGK